MMNRQEWEQKVKEYKERITNLQWDIRGLHPSQIDERRKLEKQLEDLTEQYKLLYLNMPSDQALTFKPLLIWYNDIYQLGIQYLNGKMILFNLEDMPSVGKQFMDNNPRLLKEGEDYYIIFRDSLDVLGLRHRYHKVVLEEKPTVIREVVKEKVGSLSEPKSNNRFEKNIVVAKVRVDQLVCEKGHIISKFGAWKACPICKSKFISDSKEVTPVSNETQSTVCDTKYRVTTVENDVTPVRNRTVKNKGILDKILKR